MNQYLPYRGQIRGLVSAGHQAAFVTSHVEGQTTALYRLDARAEKLSLSAENLSCGATALVTDGTTLWCAGEDGKLYQAAFAKGKPRPLSKLDFGADPVLGLALLSADRLAVLQSRQLTLVDYKKQVVLQTFANSEPATSLSSSPDGLWLALGHEQGTVSVYHSDESSRALSLAGTGKVHQGAVSALHFETHELRFYSAGQDKKLFLTHAQGVLQPLDKGRSSNHEATINVIHLGAERFFTGANDKSIKAWPYAGGQPVTIKQGLTHVLALATLNYQDKPCLIAAGDDASLRLIGLTAEEKFTELKVIIQDGYASANQALSSQKPEEREQALDFLAAYDDRQALDIINKHFNNEQDNAIRERVVTLVSRSQHPRSTLLLETFLKDKRHAIIRQQALAHLLKRAKADDFSPHEKALATGYPDIGTQALEHLAKLAKKAARAEQLLVQTLHHHHVPQLRLLALSLLETVYDKTSPKASLQALQSRHTDLQRAALIRLFQRQSLDDSAVKRAILLAQDHADAQLRHTAFLVAILSQKTLAQALKSREATLARQLQELEDFDLLAQDKQTGKAQRKATKSPRRTSLDGLGHDDYAVLLQGMSNRHADTCFTAAFVLAVLQDQRAFGALLLLSQEKEATIRAGVCRAFACLGQSESIRSLELMLDDKDTKVRDAAFSALQQLQADPLLSAERGLQSQYQDMHARGLKVLLDTLKETARQNVQTRSLELLKAALNDRFEAIRQETFKACLNRQLGGSEADTLRLLLSSRFDNIHQEVLNELMAKSTVLPAIDWVEPLLFELFNDAFAPVRLAGFQFAIAEKKRFLPQKVLAVAVQSRFIDVRQAAFNHIKRKPTQAHQQHLHVLINDDDETLRKEAITALVVGHQHSALLAALESPYDDVQVSAALALAAWGEPRAYELLNDLLAHPEPHDGHEKVHWYAITEQALAGVAALGDARAFASVMRFIRHQDRTLAEQAAKALPWVVKAEHSGQLLALQADERKPVRIQASFALALLGHERSGLLAYEHKLIDKHIAIHHQLAAAICLGEVTPITLQRYLTHPDTSLSALLVLACHELLLHSAEPYLSTWALSIAKPELQLFCADLMRCYSDPEACWTHLRTWLVQAHRNNADERWDIDTDALKQMAAILVYGDGSVKAQLLAVTALLDNLSPLKTWQLHYQAFNERYADAIAAAVQRVPTATPPKPLQADWNQRAFGAYLGLIRQSASRRRHNLTPRLKALSSLQRLAEQDDSLRNSVMSCLLTLLNHEQVQLRQLAFDSLKALGMDLVSLGHTATTSPQKDIARQGLQLLQEHYPLKQAYDLLQNLIKGDHELLAIEAYKLHCDAGGLFKAAPYALQSHHLLLRQQCVAELAGRFAASEAQQLLLQASRNDFIPAAITAAHHLAHHQHPQALTALQQLLADNQDEQQQSAMINALTTLQDPQVAEYLLDYLANNRHNRQAPERLYKAIANYRHTGVFKTLLQRLESHPKEARPITETLLKITGYDQPLLDYDEENADRSWLEQQYPRRDALLIQLFNTLIKLNHHKAAASLCQGVGWAQDTAADQALLEAIPVIDNQYLPAVIAAIVHRLDKRQGKVDGLLQVLSHKDTEVQFLAAEGLARHGHHQGFSILLSAIDYQQDADYRQRAVLALGKLGDLRALDKLLKLAEEQEHFLNEAAIEAVGYMGHSEHSEKIFKLLQTSLHHADYHSDRPERALNGLRWFNTLAAWQSICDYIEDTDHHWHHRQHAVSLLQHWDTAASRTLLLKLLQQEQVYSMVATAYRTAQRLWAVSESVSEPEYALIQGYHPDIDKKALERVAEHAPTAQLLVLLAAHYPDTTQTQTIIRSLGHSLLKRTDYSTSDLKKALQANNTEVISIIARLLARMPKLPKTVQTSLQSALDKYYQHWRQQRLQMAQNAQLRKRFEQTQHVLLQLLWSNVKHTIIGTTVMDVLTTEQKAQRPLQSQILKALLIQDKIDDSSVLAALASLANSALPEISTLANQVLAKQGKTADLQWHNFLSQPTLLLDEQFAAALTAAASQSAHQAQALPALIAKQDSATLHTIARDEQQQENLRIGAIEGLALILNTQAQQALQDISRNSQDQDIGKAAYRALRRQQRSRYKAERQAAATGAEP